MTAADPGQSLIEVLELLQEDVIREQGRSIAERMRLCIAISGAIDTIRASHPASASTRRALQDVAAEAKGWHCFDPTYAQDLASRLTDS